MSKLAFERQQESRRESQGKPGIPLVRRSSDIVAFLSLAILGLVVTVAMGCQARADRTLTSIVVFEPSTSEDMYDRCWEGAQQTLRRNRFRLDRVDKSAGVITSYPVLSQSFFEFWRHDVDSHADLLESTINPIRRRAELRFLKADDGGLRRLEVIVRKERLSAPDRQFNSTSAAYRLFGETLPTTTGQKVDGTGEDWLDVGRDEYMEDYLRQSVMSTVQANRTNDQPSADSSQGQEQAPTKSVNPSEDS